ncbi:hypothetical protein CAPTEDRAFT_228490 [Capitella teleta]|uniref:MICOS complex subunit MIC60 n=1 Tax=Capitella teleta TaxID=283909 RepID=R7TEZ6_CAPTE|nr:hypothetical protein CAPTEDRAFT_228490 [Capitella teleta]|eukprot:ELT92067.1 hypothetical protein CAPTEDRAFT_228490 [Capitella teleta]
MSSCVHKLKKAQSDSRIATEFRDLVHKGQQQFKKELEAISPEVKLGQQGELLHCKMTEEELNSLIAHAHRRIEQLQRQLAAQQSLERKRVDEALTKQQEEDDTLASQRVSQEKQHWQEELRTLKQEWQHEARVEFESDLRHQLKRQAAAHSDHLTEVLRAQQKELEAIHQVVLGESLLQERDTFKMQIAGYVSRLKGIEAAVEARADMEKQMRQAQELWLACQSLYGAIKSGKPGAEVGEAQVRPLDMELAAIQEASGLHPVVSTILDAVPVEAAKRGVWTEEALVNRFENVHTSCRRVALVDEANTTPLRYFLSYLQSFFIFKGTIVEDDLVDPSNLDTFVLVESAARALEGGNLEQAVRFMNQLQGEPRRVAADWLKEAVLALEAQQAANALLAHAAASGLAAFY